MKVISTELIPTDQRTPDMYAGLPLYPAEEEVYGTVLAVKASPGKKRKKRTSNLSRRPAWFRAMRAAGRVQGQE